MDKKEWKIIGIVLLIVVIIETSLIGYFMYAGTKMIENEERCSYEICDIKEAMSYTYQNGVCYCLDENGEIVKQKRLG